MKVIKEKPSLVLRKFLKGLGYSVAVAAITYALEFFKEMPVSPEESLYVGLLITVLQALKKSLEEFDRRRYLVSMKRKK